MSYPIINVDIIDLITSKGRISKKLFEKVVIPKLDRLEKLEYQNKKLIEALKVYASDSRWSHGRNELEPIFILLGNETDAKQFARAVLKEVENELYKLANQLMIDLTKLTNKQLLEIFDKAMLDGNKELMAQVLEESNKRIKK